MFDREKNAVVLNHYRASSLLGGGMALKIRSSEPTQTS